MDRFLGLSSCGAKPWPPKLPFGQWTEVLGSERLTGAVLDRLTHRCHILEATGESYRLQDARRQRHDVAAEGQKTVEEPPQAEPKESAPEEKTS